VPLGSSEQLIERNDFRLAEITPKELEGLVFGSMNTTWPSWEPGR
jgi:hypothetical protein